MWGISIYLIRLAEYLQVRKDNRNCKLCNYKAKNEKYLHDHIQKEHKT